MTPTSTTAPLAATGELSSSVQPLETKGVSHDSALDRSAHPLSLQSRTQTRVHAPHRRPRSRLVNALWSDGADDLGRRALRLAACCQLPSIRLRPDGVPRVDLARCRDRLCPHCASFRGRECAERVSDSIDECNCPRFGTLTLADDGQPLADRLNRLMQAFRDLRKTDLWKRCVKGCVATIEVTLGGDSRHWHAHLHFIWDGDYMPQPQLKQAWHETTGDSYIVYIKAVHGKRQAAHYIAAYIAKPLAVHTWTEEEIREYARAVHGRRLLSTSGSFHAVNADSDETPDVPPPSTHLCQVHAVHAQEHRGCEHTRHAADILARLSPTLAMTLDRPVTPLNTSLPPADPREVAFALSVFGEIERCFPRPAAVSDLEQIRRTHFGLPEPPPKPRERQAWIQDRCGW